jgi:hypothetical protein
MEATGTMMSARDAAIRPWPPVCTQASGTCKTGRLRPSVGLCLQCRYFSSDGASHSRCPLRSRASRFGAAAGVLLS